MFASTPSTCTRRTLDLPRKDWDIRCLRYLGNSDIANFLDPRAVARFIKVAGTVAPTLVIGDTLARCMPGGDENSARDMGLLVEHTDEVRRRVGCTFSWVHHTNRAGTGERGSSALRGACDTLWSLSKMQVLTCEKQRDAEPFRRVRLRLTPCYGSCVVEVAPGPNAGQQANGSELEEAVFNYVQQNPGRSTRAVASGLNRNRTGDITGSCGSAA